MKHRYNIGDKLEDMCVGGIIEIIEYIGNAYNITVDGKSWSYGCNERYLNEHCVLLNKRKKND